jgi:RNA polymerase sigma factor (sigma-70 family)
MGKLETTALSHDELEAIRLCDGEGMSQEQAASSMHVSRGTVQRTLAAARKKLADALVSGHAIVLRSAEEEG